MKRGKGLPNDLTSQHKMCSKWVILSSLFQFCIWIENNDVRPAVYSHSLGIQNVGLFYFFCKDSVLWPPVKSLCFFITVSLVLCTYMPCELGMKKEICIESKYNMYWVSLWKVSMILESYLSNSNILMLKTFVSATF